MKTLLFFAFTATLIIVLNALPAPETSPERAPSGPSYQRIAREVPEAKNDLEGSESHYVAYPYVYPPYWGHYVVVG